MICATCGGNSISTTICDYCGNSLSNIDSFNEINLQSTVVRGNLRYRINSRTPVEGVVVSYYSSGQLESSEIYKAGVKDGLAEYFDESGNLTGSITYKAGVKDGESEVYGDVGKGWQRQTQYYKKGARERLELFYPNSQQTQFSAIMTGDKRTVKEYYENGQLKEKYDRNAELKKNGPYESYFEDGRLKEKSIYRNGQLVSAGESSEDNIKSKASKKKGFGGWFKGD